MRRDAWRVVAAALVAVWLAPLPAGAYGSVEVYATALSLFRQEPRDGRVYTTLPTWTLLKFATRANLPMKSSAGLVVSSWARFDAGSPRDGRRVAGDIGLAYVDGSFARDRLQLRAGRQLLFEGAGRGLHMDGVTVRATPWQGLGASLWAGVPVRPLADYTRGAGLGGGRLFWRQSSDAEVGVSFLHLQEFGRPSHQDLGVDARWRMFHSLQWMGFVRWSTLEALTPPMNAAVRPSDPVEGWSPADNAQILADSTPRVADAWSRVTAPLQEAQLAMIWQPVAQGQLMLDYRRTTPGMLISKASIFSVFSDERRDHLGGTLALDVPEVGYSPADGPWPRARLGAQLQSDAYALATSQGWGLTGGVRGTGRLRMLADDATVGAEARILSLQYNGYWQARLFGSHRLWNVLNLSGDADLHVLHKPVHGRWVEASLTGTTFVALPGGFNVGGALVAGTSPLVDYRFEALLRLSWGAAVPLSGRLL